jgi:diguanylate cyclase
MLNPDGLVDDSLPSGSARARAMAAWSRRLARQPLSVVSQTPAEPRAASLPAAATPLGQDIAIDEQDRLRFPRRVRALRTLGLGLGGLMVGATLLEQGAGVVWLLLLALNALAWPQLAWLRARRAADPRRAERENLLVDSAAGGLWIAAMQLAVVPSTLLVAMLLTDKVAVDGWRFALRAFGLQLACFVLAWSALGWPMAPLTGLWPLLAAVPFVIAYPLAIGQALFSSERRVRRQNRELRDLNRIDALTGIGNRVAFEETAGAELRRSRRSRRPASLLLLDIDDFKSINDRHGHVHGDEVLRRVASVVRCALRDIDGAFRYGGDEFAVVLPESVEASAVQVAERIRAAVAVQLFAWAPALRCTVSIGVAEAMGEPGANAWIEQADRALYAAKAAGRNAVRGVSMS